MKPLKAVLIEYADPDKGWQFFTVRRGVTPTEALTDYMAQNHCMVREGSMSDNGHDKTYKIIADGDDAITDDQNTCRASYIFIE